ncbi:hypothetical protein EMIT0180MI3_360003 [Priestia megaterium]
MELGLPAKRSQPSAAPTFEMRSSVGAAEGCDLFLPGAADQGRRPKAIRYPVGSLHHPTLQPVLAGSRRRSASSG